MRKYEYFEEMRKTDERSMFLEPCHRMCLNSARTRLYTSSTDTEQGKNNTCCVQRIHTLRPTRRGQNTTRIMLTAITSHRQKNSDTRPSILRTPPRREYRMLFADFAVKVADQLQPHCSPRFSRLTRPLLFSPGELRISARGLPPSLSHLCLTQFCKSGARQLACRTHLYRSFQVPSLSRRRHASACSKRHSCSWPHTRTVSSQQLLLPRYQSRAWEVTQSLSSCP